MKTDPTILIVEDNDDDYEACYHSLSKSSSLANPLHRCRTGDEALSYLLGTDAYANPRPATPCLILLDLNLPGTDGRDVLHRLKIEPTLKLIPVIVMTVSDDESDLRECYSIGASGYVMKPIDIDGFFQSIARLHNHWFKVILQPAPNEKEDEEELDW
ncbi:response regulator [Chachezhania antarctica]|uniref:response regulator n=1 Tax=Chachezhania antarctica TaxID=2340860 RepID=UPI000EB07D00|nr:response regulator [Chachezhania antarctica]|tara:strand:- start:1421 stop:1894 length:474 start_codon:yes stop_codon:yes gene_type:complete